MAVVTGRYRNDVIAQGRPLPTKHARHIRVYARRDGVWVNVAHQATAIN